MNDEQMLISSLLTMTPGDTIVAISSAAGRASRMIVRISGPTSLVLAEKLSGVRPVHASAERRDLCIDDLKVPATVYAFHGPRSSTGEDVVEFHIPGNPLLAKMLVGELLSLGCRAAEAGEFTARAYFNGKLDLTAAEGVAATIAARSQDELRAARQLLAGALADRVRPILDNVAQTLALVEVGIDFSDEDVTFLSQSDVHAHVESATTAIDNLLGDSSRLEPLSHEPIVVLVGHPNAGKSTLLNALAGHERAVVSDIAGTTRDAISAEVALRRGIVRVIDVAGLEPVTSTDPTRRQIDEQMQATALRTIESADVVVHVDDTLITGSSTLGIARDADVHVFSKADIPPKLVTGSTGAIYVSAFSGQGIDRLRDRLDELCFGNTSERATLALNTRHVAALSDARAALERAAAANEKSAGAEVVAMELREAMEYLGQIVGSISPDELLGRVFSRFCIGK